MLRFKFVGCGLLPDAETQDKATKLLFPERKTWHEFSGIKKCKKDTCSVWWTYRVKWQWKTKQQTCRWKLSYTHSGISRGWKMPLYLILSRSFITHPQTSEYLSFLKHTLRDHCSACIKLCQKKRKPFVFNSNSDPLLPGVELEHPRHGTANWMRTMKQRVTLCREASSFEDSLAGMVWWSLNGGFNTIFNLSENQKKTTFLGNHSVLLPSYSVGSLRVHFVSCQEKCRPWSVY